MQENKWNKDLQPEYDSSFCWLSQLIRSSLILLVSWPKQKTYFPYSFSADLHGFCWTCSFFVSKNFYFINFVSKNLRADCKCNLLLCWDFRKILLYKPLRSCWSFVYSKAEINQPVISTSCTWLECFHISSRGRRKLEDIRQFIVKDLNIRVKGFMLPFIVQHNVKLFLFL